MIIQHNIQSLNTQRSLKTSEKNGAKSSEKLSTGYKINRAADNAAGLQISEKLRAQVRGLNQSVNNIRDGISLVQIVDGALDEAHSILHRMNELAIQSANDTNTTIDRDAIKQEIDQLAHEIDRISSTTQFNSMNMLDGTFTGKNLQVGQLSKQNISLDLKMLNTAALGFTQDTTGATTADPKLENIEATKDAYGNALTAGAMYPTTATSKMMVDTFEHAGVTMTLVQNAVNIVSEYRAELGAIQNRLEHAEAGNANTAENTQAAESRLRDTDMAAEMVEHSKNNILQQAGQAMLVQANQAKQGVMSLLQQ